jgi:thiamine-phosphate pyrophosphorylase
LLNSVNYCIPCYFPDTLLITPELTPAASRALDAARLWAGRMGAAEVQPVHLLLGLLEEEQGRAALLLTRAGLSPAGVRQSLAAQAPLPSDQDPACVLPLAGSSVAVLQAARAVALDWTSERTVAGDHLLVSLLRSDESLVATLVPMGFSLARLESAAASPDGPVLRLDEPLELPEPVDQAGALRVLDAAANRAREALRVLEDYARFVVDDRFLTGELKQLRHELTGILSQLPADELLAARDTLRDVGTELSTAGELSRGCSSDVVQANCKRLQEALRSLEEFGKMRRSGIGQALEKVRYRSYVVERALLLGASARQRLADARLQVLVTGARCAAGLEWTVRQAIAGGARVIQLREKSLTDRELLDRAQRVGRWTRETGALFIVNDRADIARLVEADGVHVGQDELPVLEARRIVGPNALVGVSTHDLEQVRQALLDGASYIGVGPTFPSPTKAFERYPGLEFVRQATAETKLPAFAIGGINLSNIEAVVQAGGRRVAVSDAICQADDPQGAAAALVRALDRQ